MVIQLPKYVTHIIGEPKYKYGQQEQVKVRNHSRRTALEPSWGRGDGVGGGGGLNRFNGIPTSHSAYVMAQNI